MFFLTYWTYTKTMAPPFMPSSDFCVPLHAFAAICTHHTLHQGGSRRLLSFFSLSEHPVSFFFSTVLLVSLASFFFSSSLPSLSPLFPLLFRSSAVAGAKNPGDTHTQAVLGNSLRIHFDTAGFEAQRKHTHTHTPLHTHTHKHTHKHSWAHPQSLHTPCAASHKHTAGLFAAGWRLWHRVAVFWCFEESEIQVGEMAVTECLEIKRQWDFIQSKNFLAYFLKQSSIGQILKSNPCRKHTRKSFMLQQCWLNSSGRTGAVEAGEAFQSKM